MRLSRAFILGLLFITVVGCVGRAEHGDWIKQDVLQASADADAYGCWVVATSPSSTDASTSYGLTRPSPFSSSSSSKELNAKAYDQCMQVKGYEWISTAASRSIPAQHKSHRIVGTAFSAIDMQRAVDAASQTPSPPDGFTVNLPQIGTDTFPAPRRAELTRLAR